MSVSSPFAVGAAGFPVVSAASRASDLQCGVQIRHSCRPRLAIVVDPRFSGGTSSAVAQEVRALHRFFDLTVYAIETSMFKGREINGRLMAALQEAGIEPVWNPKLIRAQVVALHNPSCLKFDERFDVRIVCDTAIIVTHENFLRPTGSEGFDVERCLMLIDGAVISRERLLAPVSVYNRRNVARWLEEAANRPTLRSIAGPRRWRLAPHDWFNICDFRILPPTDHPADRRGRLSRPGFEKFPAQRSMLRHFPPQAQSCVILGGDSLLADLAAIPVHWRVERFGALEPDEFFRLIDFFVYYTHPLWRESFGRVIAEAIAAGKVVITDPGTAEVFGDAVFAAEPEADIDGIIAGFVAAPDRYGAFVRQAQARLTRFSGAAFASQITQQLNAAKGTGRDLL